MVKLNDHQIIDAILAECPPAAEQGTRQQLDALPVRNSARVRRFVLFNSLVIPPQAGAVGRAAIYLAIF